MLSLDFLRIAFASGVLFWVKMARVRAPLIGRIVSQAKGLQQRLALEEPFVFTATKDLGQDRSRVMIDGMPEPTWGVFAADKRPHSSISASPARSMSTRTSPGFNVRNNPVLTDSHAGAFFLSALRTVLVLMCSDLAVSRTPLALRLMSMMRFFTSGTQPRL